MLRLFFAIELSDEWKELITAQIKKFRQEDWAQSLRWVKIENIHLTLRFIGESDEYKLASLIKHVSEMIKAIQPFSINTNHIQLFPSPHHPRVFAVIISPSADLFQLQQKIENMTQASGFHQERLSFFPHISLAYVNSKKINLPEKFSLTLPPLNVNHIVLMNSEEIKRQRIYTPLKKFYMDNISEKIIKKELSSLASISHTQATKDDNHSTKPSQPRVTVGAIVMKENKILLVKRKRAPHQGCWAIPGGKIELGETIQQAAEREIKEETGITIRAKDPIYIFDYIERDENNQIRFHYVIIDVAADYIGGDLQSGDDAEMANWFTMNEAEELNLTVSTRKFLKEKIKNN
jgi:8-oxo-dGTP diphosphatase